MPKETIKMSDNESIWDVKVGWTKDCEVQIGIENFEHKSLHWVFGVNAVEKIGEEIRKISDEAQESARYDQGIMDSVIGTKVLDMLDVVVGSYPGIWATPSRHEINDLIRVLRRARDSAYGRDE